MSSEVYFRFKASIKTDTIPFDGSAISVKDLKNAIKTKCCLRTNDFELKLEDNSGKEYTKDNERIPKYTNIIVRRVPKVSSDAQKRRPPQASIIREKNCVNTDIVHANSSSSLADMDLPDDEKIRLMIERSSEPLSSKHFTVKAKAYGVPPPNYVCHKCNQSGHWIHECPGIKDVRGNLLDSKTVKRPTGIPQDFLLRVEPGTPGAYLDKNGRYMVPIKDAEAYLQSKKEKRPFSVEENPPYVPPQKPQPSEGLLCPLCRNICRDAVLVTCCGTSYCNECIVNYCFVDGAHKCPNCGSPKEKLESSIVENASLRRTIEDWLLSSNASEVSNDNQTQKLIVQESDVAKTEIVRRVLKPKQQVVSNSGLNAEGNPAETPKDSTDPCADTEESKESKETAPKEASDSQSPRSTKSPLTVKPDSSVNKPSDSLASVISNTSSLANLPCGNSLGTENVTSVMANLPSVASIYNGPHLVFPSENAASLASLAAFSSVGQPQSSLNPVFPSNPLIPPGSIWPSMDQLSLLGNVDQNGFSRSNDLFSAVNPLMDLRGIVPSNKVLSKEEFYGIQRKYAEESHRRRRRSRSGDSPPRHRRGVADDHYSRRRDEDRRLRRRTPPRRRRSRSSGSERRRRGERAPIEDYDTWRRRKDRRLQMEAAARGRVSPFRVSRRSDSPNPASLLPASKREVSHEFSPEYSRKYLDSMDKSRLRSPFHGGTPTRRSLEDVSPFRDDNSRVTDRNSRRDGVELLQKLSLSREDSASFTTSFSQLANPQVDLDAKVLKKLRKEQKKRAKRERKLARRAARAQKAAAAAAAGESISYDTSNPTSPLLLDDQFQGASGSKSRRDKKKKKRRHRHERDSNSDPESVTKSKRPRKVKSKRLTSSEDEVDDVVEVC